MRTTCALISTGLSCIRVCGPSGYVLLMGSIDVKTHVVGKASDTCCIWMSTIHVVPVIDGIVIKFEVTVIIDHRDSVTLHRKDCSIESIDALVSIQCIGYPGKDGTNVHLRSAGFSLVYQSLVLICETIERLWI